ncbi:hypothetical protein TNCV_3650901 [Trichonephila clavipes]|uniref:Uncharacterized protein n=1 Tax=Trichonephila clavipes TaxID=2585209 RepID=A0A8X6VH37_TRICX|nr:hypothetical protein TNCV_3650901 [Trichonephila clavipes]
MHVKSLDSSNLLRWGSVVVRREGSAQVSPSSLDHASKLRGSSPKAPRVAEQCDVNIHSLGDGPRNFKPWSSDEDDA